MGKLRSAGHTWPAKRRRVAANRVLPEEENIQEHFFALLCFFAPTSCLICKCPSVPQPSGKGKRLPEVHCVVSKLGCFNLFAKVNLPPIQAFTKRRERADLLKFTRLIPLKCVGELRAPPSSTPPVYAEGTRLRRRIIPANPLGVFYRRQKKKKTNRKIPRRSLGGSAN